MSTPLPELAVFDLDDCLWSPEMYTLNDVPTANDCITGSLGVSGEGIIAVRSGHHEIRLFPDALLVLQKIYLGEYPKMRIAAASSADTPLAVRIGRTSMCLLEILPGVTMREVFDQGWPDGFEAHLQIGRSTPLTSNKSETHFPILRRETNIPYHKMIFFDDCNWSDHVAMVSRACPGVIAQRTPRGLQEAEWQQALSMFANAQLLLAHCE
jgi:magnesium-dependent phosphatase 1